MQLFVDDADLIIITIIITRIPYRLYRACHMICTNMCAYCSVCMYVCTLVCMHLHVLECLWNYYTDTYIQGLCWRHTVSPIGKYLVNIHQIITLTHNPKYYKYLYFSYGRTSRSQNSQHLLSLRSGTMTENIYLVIVRMMLNATFKRGCATFYCSPFSFRSTRSI